MGRVFHIWLVVVLSCGWALGRELSTDWIEKTIHDHKIRTIEQLLSKFSPESLQYHLLAYGSESTQFASFLSPRVIVYSENADFIFTYNGEPNSAGYNDLEILRFDHGKKKFLPEIVHFDAKGIAAPKVYRTPDRCTRCHQADIRPNWDPYFHWVGFYGSEDDNVHVPDKPLGSVLTDAPENLKYEEFLKKKQAEKFAGKGRYRFLSEHPAARPNLHFNSRVTCLNLQRLLSKFASHPESGRIWPAVHDYGFVQPTLLPKDLIARSQRSFDEVAMVTESQIKAAIARRLKRHEVLTGAPPQGRAKTLMPGAPHPTVAYMVHTIAGWRLVMEDILGEDFRTYATSRHDDADLNTDAQLTIRELIRGAQVDPDSGKVVFPAVSPPPTHPARPGTYDYNCAWRTGP